MAQFGEPPELSIRPAMQEQPFTERAVRVFFKEWCKVNDSIRTHIISRDVWEEIAKEGILKDEPDGTKELFIPADMQLWEMVGVIETVDHDTFAENPSRRDQAKNQLLLLGKTFQDAGIYLAQRLDAVTAGQPLAKNLAEEFYAYGRSLSRKTAPTVLSAHMLAKLPLSTQETEKIDRFLAGDALYASRKEKAKQESPEQIRRKTLAQFFRVSQKAFELEQMKLPKGQPLPPWIHDAPIHRAFLTKVQEAMKREVESPKRELTNAMFRRGMELLRTHMPFDALPPWVKKSFLHWKNGEQTLREAIHIDRLGKELNFFRQLGDDMNTSKKERQIADLIQTVVSGYTRKDFMNNPSEIIASQSINCVGASLVGGALMGEAGLTYLVGHVPRHSILLLVTADGKVEWRDMLNVAGVLDITNDMIAGKRADGQALTVADIVAFSKNPTPDGLLFDIKGEAYRTKLPRVKKGEKQFVGVFGPEYGQELQVLNNTGNALYDLGMYEEAIEAYRQAITRSPKFDYAYNGLGNALNMIRREKEAIQVFRQALQIDESSPYLYNGLGNALRDLGRYEEAASTYKKAIELDRSSAMPHYSFAVLFERTGQSEKAIEEYRTCIALANKEKEAKLIKLAEEHIKKLGAQ